MKISNPPLNQTLSTNNTHREDDSANLVLSPNSERKIFKQEISRKDRYISKLEKKLETIGEQLTTLRESKIPKMIHFIDEKELKINKMNKKLVKLDFQNSQQTKIIEKKERDEKARERERIELQHELTSLRSLRTQRDSELKELRSDLNESRSFVMGATLDQRQLHSTIIRNDRLRNQLEELIQSQKTRYEEEVDDLKLSHHKEVMRVAEENEEMAGVIESLLDELKLQKSSTSGLLNAEESLQDLSFKGLTPLHLETAPSHIIPCTKLDLSKLASTMSINQEDYEGQSGGSQLRTPNLTQDGVLSQEIGIQESARLFLENWKSGHARPRPMNHNSPQKSGRLLSGRQRDRENLNSSEESIIVEFDAVKDVKSCLERPELLGQDIQQPTLPYSQNNDEEDQRPTYQVNRSYSSELLLVSSRGNRSLCGGVCSLI